MVIKIFNFLVNSFFIKKEDGFNKTQISKAMNYSKILFNEKTFGIFNKPILNTTIINDELDNEDIKVFSSLINNNKVFSNSKNIDYNGEERITEFLDKSNNYFQSFTNLTDFKLNLLKRIDIYSFGIMILQCIYTYKKNNSDTFRGNPNLRKLIMGLYEIAFDCCVQFPEDGEKMDINDIIDKYSDLLLKYRISPFSSPINTSSINSSPINSSPNTSPINSSPNTSPINSSPINTSISIFQPPV